MLRQIIAKYAEEEEMNFPKPQRQRRSRESQSTQYQVFDCIVLVSDNRIYIREDMSDAESITTVLRQIVRSICFQVRCKTLPKVVEEQNADGDVEFVSVNYDGIFSREDVDSVLRNRFSALVINNNNDKHQSHNGIEQKR